MRAAASAGRWRSRWPTILRMLGGAATPAAPIRSAPAGGEDAIDAPSRLALLGLLAGLGAIVGGVASADAAESVDPGMTTSGATPSEAWNLIKLETRKRTFFKYEKRVRTLSTPEKVFEYFSSTTVDGVKYMTHFDLLRSLVAVYPPEGTTLERAGSLLGERAPVPVCPTRQHTDFFALFDFSGDNLISFTEYLLMLTLVSIPLRDVELVFDIVDADNSGDVDHNEFNKIVDQMQNMSRQAKSSRGGMRTGLTVGDNKINGRRPSDLEGV
eukprot:evm.model.scf_2936EXC.3 EVM.evm.TU.scf_2936EXC.3   scf_2936EXC:14320-17082(-)